ncbi:fimbrial protein [Stenotrophomonas sp. PD6]|uniref:fimbrial protein n=1 Tax=Stenotrophomonas sp. PD6 TaxID=3368612 RepID=UPI003B9F7D73
MSASLQLLHPTPPPMNLVLYAPARDLATLLEARLPVGMRVQWQDSAAPIDALDAQRRGTPCVILLDYRREAAGLSSELARHLQRSHPDLPLVAVGSTAPDQVDGIVAAVRMGLRDILDLESTTSDIDAVLRRAGAAPHPVRSVPADAVHKARLVLLLGVRAGVGSSTLAAHLGVLAQQLGHPGAADGSSAEPPPPSNATLLLDLGQPAGDAALYLNLDSQFHYDDALRNANRIDATLVRTAMTRHPGGLTLLGQPAGSEGGLIADPAVLVQRLRGVFETVLCDLGGVPVRQVPRSLLNSADEIWLVADQAISTLVSLDQVLKQLDALGVRDARVQLVVNRHEEDGGLSPAQIAARFSLPLLATLPDCHRLRASANHGHLLLQDAPRDPYLRALTPLLLHLDEAAARALPRSWREKIALALGGLQWKSK